MVDLIAEFSDDEASKVWFASVCWLDGSCCAHCDHNDVQLTTVYPTMNR